MSESLPKFEEPPLVETTMGVQFKKLSDFSAPLHGWFWKSYLPKTSEEKWPRVNEAARLEERIERFGENEQWSQLGLKVYAGPEPQRTQIFREDNQRLIQLQDSRFILNWRKGDGKYPTYSLILKEFFDLYPIFEQFVGDTGKGALEPNQWEISYVNHIPKGPLWQTAQEWERVIPKIGFPAAPVTGHEAEPISLDWRFDFADERGRLYVSLQNARKSPEPTAENFMQLALTARGAVDSEKGWALKDGFGLGHEAIVRTFVEMTSPEAHKLWKRRI